MGQVKNEAKWLLAALPLLFVISFPARAATGLYSKTTLLTAPTPTSGGEFSNGGFFCDGNVALSGNGSVAVVGSPYASAGTGEGVAYFYQYLNNRWQETQTVSDPGTGSGDQFGSCIVLSADGTSALIGSAAAVNGQSGAGKAYLYTLSGGVWTESHEFDDPPAIVNDGFGSSGGLGISANGDTLLIAAVGTSVNGVTDAGVVYVESLINGRWVQTAIPDPDDQVDDAFGSAAALTLDGSEALIGSAAAVNGQSSAGKAYLYSISDGQVTETHEFDDPPAQAGDHFGYADVALSENGQTALVGAWGTDVNGVSGAGQAYVFRELNGVWTETQALPDPNGLAGDGFGFPTALSDNGRIALVGSDATVNGLSNAGQAYRYNLVHGVWTLTKTLTASTPTAGDGFSDNGFALSGAGNTALIGDPYATVNGLSRAGEADLYQSTIDLGIGISPNQNPFSSADAEALELTVSNLDPEASAGDVTVTDTIPSGLQFLGANPDEGECSTAANTVTCLLRTLSPGAVWNPSIWVGARQTSGTVVDQASVSSNEADPNPANNQASVAVEMVPPPPAPSTSSGSGSFGIEALIVLMALLIARRRRTAAKTS